MSKLTFTPKLMNTIRGDRYYFEVTKEEKNTPGFAPETYTTQVCDVVVKFLGKDEPYIQLTNEGIILNPTELQEIAQRAEKGFIQEEFKDLV